jgi:hypothetical protein
VVQGENAERWRELCLLAATEQDPDRLLALIREINMLLERKELRLKSRTEGDAPQEVAAVHLCESNCC